MANLMQVSQRTISRWERGDDSPGIVQRKRLRDLGLVPPEVLLRNLVASVVHCPAPRALSCTQKLRLVAVSKPAIEKRPSISDWIGRDLADIACGVLQQMLDDTVLQRAISKKEIAGVVSTTKGVLRTGDSSRIGRFRTTISYFFHEGTLYSDAISAPVSASEACGYTVFPSDEIGMAVRAT